MSSHQWCLCGNIYVNMLNSYSRTMQRSCYNFILVFCAIFFVQTLAFSNAKSQALNTRKCLIWGPGLEAQIVLPARYFFIQLVDTDGNNITESVGEKTISVEITLARTGEQARIWTQVLDRHDGSYIVRYKLYDSYKDLKINVYFGTKHLADSPYKLRGSVVSDDCYCPQPDRSKWMRSMKCPKTYEQIKRDLSLFTKIDMKAVEAEAVAKFNRRGSHSLCHYTIKDNQIYRKTHGEHVGFKMFMDNILLSLARKVKLPDMEFFVNLGDWPLVQKKLKDKPLPILSWCGSDDTNDIIMPTYDITESTLETMGRVMLDLMSVQANTGPKWENKTEKGFFRGRDSRQERLDLVKLSRKHPEILDAKLTNMFFFKHDKEELGELVKHISFFDFFKHKYQINLDGTVAAYRLPYLLAGDAVVLKQDSPYYEFFYKDLIPYKHYIPIKRDISDVLEKIRWAKDNDKEAQQIAKNAQRYVRDHLLADEILCYHMVLFEEYSKLLVSKPHIYKEMERVDQPTPTQSCHCDHPDANGVRRDEL